MGDMRETNGKLYNVHYDAALSSLIDRDYHSANYHCQRAMEKLSRDELLQAEVIHELHAEAIKGICEEYKKNFRRDAA